MKMSSNKNGQVAVILLILTAITLVFYAITLNVGKMSATKTVVTRASNTSTALLASQMASYGQSLFQSQLGGRKKKCKSNGILAAIITLIVVIIIIIVSWGSTVSLLGVWGAAFVAGVTIALSIANVVLQVTVVQPGITRMWDKIMRETLTQEGYFLESGIRVGTSAIADPIQVADLFDHDQDRVFGYTGVIPNDKISRYSVYYSDRLASIQTNNIPEIDIFMTELADLLNNFLYDPVGVNHGCFFNNIAVPVDVPSVCNPCCIPATVEEQSVDPVTGNNIIINVPFRPVCCDLPDVAAGVPDPGRCGLSTTCQTLSPYGTPHPLLANTHFSLVYDPYFENHDIAGNPPTFLSFREQLGRDDEHQAYRKDSARVLDSNNPSDYPQIPHTDVIPDLQGFQVEDATGYYALDQKHGIYPFFYAIADWGLDLASILPLNEWCYWFDSTYGPTCLAVTPSVLGPPLILPLDSSTLIWDRTLRVNSVLNNLAGNPPIASDKMQLPFQIAGLDPIIADDFSCAQFSLSTPTIGLWKRGDDNYCTGGDVPPPEAWPYFGNCPRHNYATCEEDDGGSPPQFERIDCSCADTPAVNRNEFTEDIIDDIVFELDLMIQWAQDTVSLAGPGAQQAFDSWYAGSATWIEPYPATQASTPPCFYCLDENGRMWVMAEKMREISRRLTDWAETPFVGADVWCVPPLGAPVPAEEIAIGGTTTRGDMESIINCLDWNVNDITAVATLLDATGNAEKFERCFSNCAVAGACTNLPRTLVPGFNPNGAVDCTAAADGGDPTVVATNNYMENIRLSWREARNQVAKFERRLNYLQYVFDGLADITSLMNTAATRFETFLNGPASGLITARINQANNPDEQLPYHFIYGWQDEPREGDPIGSGLWHVVRADMRIPKRCDRACDITQTNYRSWPRVKTYKKGFLGSKRCYELTDEYGVVKSRVVRFDADYQNNQLLRFPNGVPIWEFRFTNPLRSSPGFNPSFIATTLNVQCANSILPDPPGLIPGGAETDIYGGAFMVNERAEDPNCWDTSMRLLSVGVMSETCAKYYYHEGGINKGMGIKFVDCLDF